MRVNLGGFDILVAQLLLHGADIRPRFEQVGGEGMPQHVAGNLFFNATHRCGSFQCPVDIGFIDMMAAQLAAIGIDCQTGRRKQVLPAQSPAGFSILVQERILQPHPGKPRQLTVFFQVQAHTLNLAL